MEAGEHRTQRIDDRQRTVCLAALLALVWAVPAAATGRITVTADSISVSGMAAHGLQLTIEPQRAGAARLGVRAVAVSGPDTPPGLKTLRLDCPALIVKGDALRCADGRASGEFGEFGPQDSPADLTISADGALTIRLPALNLADGQAALDATLRDDRWTANIRLEQVELGALGRLAALREALPDGFTLAGRLSGELHIAGRGASVGEARARLVLADTGFADQAGTLAGEQVVAGLELWAGAPARDGHRSVSLQLDATGGQVYIDPIFVDLGRNPVHLAVTGTLPEDAATLSATHFRWSQEGVGTVDGAAELDLVGETMARWVRVVLDDVDLASAVPLYLRPLLISTPFADLAGGGFVNGEVDFDDGRPSRIQVTLRDALLDSPGGSLSVEGLTGYLHWFDEALRNELAQEVDSEIFRSRLEWRGARLWGIEFGPVALPFSSTGRGFRLLEPIVLPIFDGGLAIETLRIRHAGTPQMYVRFDAEVQPISVALLGRTLGWPEFSGTIAGRIPNLELADGLVTLGGNIEAQVFDGTVTVRDLKMRDPLGKFPQLFAHIDVDGLDLERLTNTFEFGMITGRLSGRVKALETYNWLPVAFDAAFYTTPGDRSKHRISQRAVANLSSIGGGSGGTVAAALQGGFLRFFESFGYDRLGLSCRLANDTCAMDGVGPATGGYYIVKGASIPRIDVIGNQRKVAFTRLLSQLAAVMQSPGPLVE
jgi:hypothetical protein